MLVELSVMEQRYQAVLAVVRDGWQVSEVARRLGVSRQSVHAWIARYEQGGLAALTDRSHRPASCPHQIPSEIEASICELRRQHPGWGPRRIEHQLARMGADPVPSRSSIYRCLKRHELIELRRRRKRREEFRRWERERPMQLWRARQGVPAMSLPARPEGRPLLPRPLRPPSRLEGRHLLQRGAEPTRCPRPQT